MQILPVIDLLGGDVVRGVAGQRDAYRPIESTLDAGCAPRLIAFAYQRQFEFPAVYVADLDAISGGSIAWADYRQIAAAGMRLWVDAGVTNSAHAERIVSHPQGEGLVEVIVLGLETLASPTELAEISAAIGPQRLAFSLDLKQGVPLADVSIWPSEPLEIAALAVACGISRLIVLDLAAVGVSSGTGTEDLCREINRRWPQLEIIAGGGVRGPADLIRLAECGVDQALVASALHDGRLTPQDVAAIRDRPRP